MTVPTATRWWRPRSVRQQLVLGVSAVITVVLVAVGVVSVLNLRSYITAMKDADVSEALNALAHSYARYHRNDTDPAAVEHALLGFTEQEPGNLIAVLHNGNVVGTAVFVADDEPRAAPADVAAIIGSRPWSDRPAQTVDLDTLGTYRMESRSVDGGDRLVVGVSLDLVNRTIARRIITATVFLAIALLLTAALTVWVVGYTLRPLRRVAATAAAVAGMSLAGGDDRITARVPQQNTDPEEVGVVAQALNRLLDNVDNALAYRIESDKRMRQFITDASHELRTPLAAIQGYAELTRQDSSTLPPTTEYALARIESEAQRMTALVDELLLLSRLGEGQDLQVEDVDLVDLSIHAVNDTAASAPTHIWVKELPNEAVWVRGDQARLHQLLTNLLANAWVHTPPGVTVTTGITTQRTGVGGPYAELTVTDTGPDIEPALLPHLFDRFVRADTARSGESGSTGLGLTIVASIVKAHHGTVTAESENGQTVFRIRLPLSRQSDPPAA